MTETRTVDCRGLACPQPVLSTKDALAGATSPLVVIVDNEGSATNVQRFAESQGARVTVSRDGADYHLAIEPGDGVAGGEEPPIVCTTSPRGQQVVYVASAQMGRGDDELGDVLMAAFLDTLSQFRGEVSHAIFVNAGARLAVEGSPVLEQLRQLEEVGVEVLVCGTCLNHFGIADRLAVGSVSNMYAIIETLAGAGRIIRP
jgi:selenium metabolism protein YedF